jgi:hypothetical protein
MTDYPPVEWKGKLYKRGSAGSIMLLCPQCNRIHYRACHNYFFDKEHFGKEEFCVWDGTKLELIESEPRLPIDCQSGRW